MTNIDHREIIEKLGYASKTGGKNYYHLEGEYYIDLSDRRYIVVDRKCLFSKTRIKEVVLVIDTVDVVSNTEVVNQVREFVMRDKYIVNSILNNELLTKVIGYIFFNTEGEFIIDHCIYYDGNKKSYSLEFYTTDRAITISLRMELYVEEGNRLDIVILDESKIDYNVPGLVIDHKKSVELKRWRCSLHDYMNVVSNSLNEFWNWYRYISRLDSALMAILPGDRVTHSILCGKYKVSEKFQQPDNIVKSYIYLTYMDGEILRSIKALFRSDKNPYCIAKLYDSNIDYIITYDCGKEFILKELGDLTRDCVNRLSKYCNKLNTNWSILREPPYLRLVSTRVYVEPNNVWSEAKYFIYLSENVQVTVNYIIDKGGYCEIEGYNEKLAITPIEELVYKYILTTGKHSLLCLD